MKKKYYATFVIAIVAVFAGYNIYQSQNTMDTMSDLALANVEALAGNGELPEVDVSCGKSGGKCWQFDGYCYKGEYTYNKCTFNGSQYSSCSSNC